MKKFNKIGMIGIVMLVIAIGVTIVRAQITLTLATQITKCTIAEQAATGASHKIEVSYADLITSASVTNESMLASFPIAAKMGVQVKYAILNTAFSGPTYTNGTESLTVIVGDGGDDNRFLASMELAALNTEIWLQYGTGTQLAYTTADTIDLTFQPNAQEQLDSLTAGKMTVYLDIIDAR